MGLGRSPNIRYDQSGDVIYIACYGQQQAKIERRAAHGWSVVTYRSVAGPFMDTPTIEANFTPAACYGTTTLTSDRPFFQAGHVGALLQLLSSGQTNNAVLGANNAATDTVRVAGVGTAARDYIWTVSGTFVATVALERSFDGPDSGFSQVLQTGTTTPFLTYTSLTSPFTIGAFVTGGTSGASAEILNNVNSGTTGTLTLDPGIFPGRSSPTRR